MDSVVSMESGVVTESGLTTGSSLATGPSSVVGLAEDVRRGGLGATVEASPMVCHEPASHAAVRATLKKQIARLEREIGALVVSACPRIALESSRGRVGAARLLDVAELEQRRDQLAVEAQGLRNRLDRRSKVQEANRGLLEAMRRSPGSFRWRRVANEDIGEPGCTEWRARPRMGLIGMLMGWWRVKLSSGCP